MSLISSSCCVCVCVCDAHLVAQVLFVPRGAAPPPQFDGRGAQQVLDAAADRSAAASLRGHRAVSCPASCLSQRLDPFSVVALSSAVMLSASRAVPGQRFQLVWLCFWFWTDPVHGLRFRCCSASYFSAAAKTRSCPKHEPDRTDRAALRRRQDRTRH